jgi:hypothetical protein
LNTVRYCVTESQFLGTELMWAVESAAGPTTTITVTLTVTVTIESGEWQFSLQQQA